MAFVSANNTSSTNDINDDDLEEMDLKWQVAMISMRIKKFHKRIGRTLQFDTRDTVGFDKTKMKCFNCYKIGHFTRDCSAKWNQDRRRKDGGYNGNKSSDNSRRPAHQDNSKVICTDIANITRKEQKPGKNGHENGKSTQNPEEFQQSQQKSSPRHLK
nr:ribonuclease H-like domain-containing protein [Tanacetum cinerariifolium]